MKEFSKQDPDDELPIDWENQDVQNLLEQLEELFSQYFPDQNHAYLGLKFIQSLEFPSQPNSPRQVIVFSKVLSDQFDAGETDDPEVFDEKPDRLNLPFFYFHNFHLPPSLDRVTFKGQTFPQLVVDENQTAYFLENHFYIGKNLIQKVESVRKSPLANRLKDQREDYILEENLEHTLDSEEIDSLLKLPDGDSHFFVKMDADDREKIHAFLNMVRAGLLKDPELTVVD
jgi:hypothetical protein